jgi:REP element-mobilizing transposase RayT
MPDQPLAYFITFRCYGTWLPGDARGFTEWGAIYGTPKREGHRGIAGEQRRRMAGTPVSLDSRQRLCVEQSVIETCAALGWTLYAVNVRTNHVHVVVAGLTSPERILNTLKAWCTRRLRDSQLLVDAIRPWSRHGSTVYLWNERDVDAVCAYVVYGQDSKMEG